MTKLDVKLVMESKGLAPAVRGITTLHSDWSRLYQADSFYLDLMIKPKDKTSSLLGQLLSEDTSSLEGEVSLTLMHDEQTISTTTLGKDAEFFLEVDKAGTYELRISLDDTLISIDQLDLS